MAVIVAAGWFASVARAETVIWGGPTWDPITQTGYLGQFAFTPPFRSAGNGVAAGFADLYEDGARMEMHAVRWDASGSPVVVLGNASNGGYYSAAFAVNAAGTAVGFADSYHVGGNYRGDRAVRWDASGTVATELGTLGTGSGGFAMSAAFGINDAGTVVGQAQKFYSGSDMGYRPVRWDASGSATELGNLGTDSSGVTTSHALNVNAAGTAVGIASKYVAGIYKGARATRWDASGTAATELGNLGTDSSGGTTTRVNAVNGAGTSVGWAWKHHGDGFISELAVRWDASGTDATELGNLGTDGSNGRTYVSANDINDAGTAVGSAIKYVEGTRQGDRAVRWDASGTAAFELGLLGDDTYGLQASHAGAINAAGIAVGDSGYQTDYGAFDQRAVAWGLDGVPIDLNTLIDPGSGWFRLIRTHGISDTNWVTGTGYFDPGNGLIYSRTFLLDISSAVPEPGGLSIVGLATAALYRRRKRVIDTTVT